MANAMKFVVRSGVGFTAKQIQASRLFQDWYVKYQPERGRIVRKVVIVEAAAWVKGGPISVINMIATTVYSKVRTDRNWDGQGGIEQTIWITLVPPVVDVLTIVTDGTRKYVVYVEQFRPAVGEWVLSNPSGRLEEGVNPEIHALRELKQETGIDHPKRAGIQNLGHLFSWHTETVRTSTGFTNEECGYYVLEVHMATELINELHGREAGLQHSENEHTRVHVVPLGDAPSYIAPSGAMLEAKAQKSLAMYLAVHLARAVQP